jgi:site-specific DNA recombinase
LRDAHDGRFSAVLVYRVDRLGRSLRALLGAHDTLAASGVAIRSSTEPIDTTTPIGAFIFSLLGSMAELEKETIAERTSSGRVRATTAGGYTGGKIPFGYALNDDRQFIPSECLVPHVTMTEAELVADIFHRIARGETTIRGEVARLNALGVVMPTRYGGERGTVKEGPWRLSTLATMLHSTMYKGQYTLKSRYAGEVTRPMPALVDADTWQRAQEALRHNQTWSRKNAKHVYLLRGLIRCAGCGAAYTGQGSGAGRTSGRYRCHGYVNQPELKHDAKLISADWLDDAVWQETRNFILNPGPALEEARRSLRENMAEAAGIEDRLHEKQREIAHVKARQTQALELFRVGGIDPKQARKEMEAYARDIGRLEGAAESLRAQAALVDAQEALFTESAALLGRLRDELASIEAANDLGRKREVIERYVREIVVETRRVSPHRLDAQVTLHVRLKPEPIGIENGTPSRRPARRGAGSG